MGLYCHNNQGNPPKSTSLYVRIQIWHKSSCKFGLRTNSYWTWVRPDKTMWSTTSGKDWGGDEQVTASDPQLCNTLSHHTSQQAASTPPGTPSTCHAPTQQYLSPRVNNTAINHLNGA